MPESVQEVTTSVWMFGAQSGCAAHHCCSRRCKSIHWSPPFPASPTIAHHTPTDTIPTIPTITHYSHRMDSHPSPSSPPVIPLIHKYPPFAQLPANPPFISQGCLHSVRVFVDRSWISCRQSGQSRISETAQPRNVCLCASFGAWASCSMWQPQRRVQDTAENM